MFEKSVIRGKQQAFPFRCYGALAGVLIVRQQMHRKWKQQWD